MEERTSLTGRFAAAVQARQRMASGLFCDLGVSRPLLHISIFDVGYFALSLRCHALCRDHLNPVRIKILDSFCIAREARRYSVETAPPLLLRRFEEIEAATTVPSLPGAFHNYAVSVRTGGQKAAARQQNYCR